MRRTSIHFRNAELSVWKSVIDARILKFTRQTPAPPRMIHDPTRITDPARRSPFRSLTPGFRNSPANPGSSTDDSRSDANIGPRAAVPVSIIDSRISKFTRQIPAPPRRIHDPAPIPDPARRSPFRTWNVNWTALPLLGREPLPRGTRFGKEFRRSGRAPNSSGDAKARGRWLPGNVRRSRGARLDSLPR